MRAMEETAGEAHEAGLRLSFDRRIKLELPGSKVTSNGGLLAFRELDDALGLSVMAGDVLSDTRTGSNGGHTVVPASDERGRIGQGHGRLPEFGFRNAWNRFRIP